MKNRSAATDTILAASKYLLYKLYDLTLVTGQTYHFTDGEVPLNGVTVYVPGGTVGPFNYQTGIAILSDGTSQKSGVEAGQLHVTMIPVNLPDYQSSPVLIAGYTLQQAARYGFLDGATLRMSKCFLNPPTNGIFDTTPGAMGYFQGTIQGAEADRLLVEITSEDALSLLGEQQMPPKLAQVGCWHQVYDAGCGLLKATFAVTGTIVTAGDNAHFTTNLTQADDYFDLGGVTFNGNVTALLAGQVANVSSFKHTSGALAIVNPVSALPAVGDTFVIYPGCDRMQLGGCTKLSNLPRFTGIPYMPVPETILDGGTANPPPQVAGSQAGQLIGSQVSAQQTAGKYNA